MPWCRRSARHGTHVTLRREKKKAAAYPAFFICSGRAYMRFAAAGGKVYRILFFFASEDVPTASPLLLAAPGIAGPAIRFAPEPGSAADLSAGDFLSCANPDAATMVIPVRNSNARVRMGASLGKLDCRDRDTASPVTPFVVITQRCCEKLAKLIATRMPLARAKKKQSIRLASEGRSSR